MIDGTYLDDSRRRGFISVFGFGQDVDAVVVEFVEAAAEVIPQAEKDFAKISQSTDKDSIMNVEFVEPAGQLQSVMSAKKSQVRWMS